MKLILILAISTYVFINTVSVAAYPTMEGLFRNPNNKDLEGNVSVISLTIEEVEAAIEITSTDEKTLKQSVASAPRERKNIKLIFSLEKRDEVELLQVEYADSEMSDKSLMGSVFIPNFLNKVESDEYIERSLFYSLMAMFALNDSRGISNLIIKHNPGFKTNKSIMNEDKIKLLDKYKQYLLATKESEQANPELKSPLTPEDEVEKNKTTELLKSSMYGKPESIKMTKENGKFYWKLSLDKVEALFTNEFHHLKRFIWNLDSGIIEANMGEYVLLDGIHELPKFILFHNENGKEYKIGFTKLLTFYNKGNGLEKRSKSYEDLIKIRKGKKSQKQSADNIAESALNKIFLYE